MKSQKSLKNLSSSSWTAWKRKREGEADQYFTDVCIRSLGEGFPIQIIGIDGNSICFKRYFFNLRLVLEAWVGCLQLLIFQKKQKKAFKLKELYIGTLLLNVNTYLFYFFLRIENLF
jgi:hypothetical protein